MVLGRYNILLMDGMHACTVICQGVAAQVHLYPALAMANGHDVDRLTYTLPGFVRGYKSTAIGHVVY